MPQVLGQSGARAGGKIMEGTDTRRYEHSKGEADARGQRHRGATGREGRHRSVQARGGQAGVGG